jgi:hypothetical protein
MYLTRIDKKTGLLLIEDGDDGILSIKEFRELMKSEDYGIYCLTAVALVADYQSPIRYYNDIDRPKKAQEEVIGDRNKWHLNTELIQSALKKYDALQYDPTLEEKRIYYDQKVRKLQQIKEYDTLDSNDEKRKNITMAQLKKDLRSINDDIEAFTKRIEGQDIYHESPVVNGYSLSRLEQKLEKKSSFYHEIR